MKQFTIICISVMLGFLLGLAYANYKIQRKIIRVAYAYGYHDYWLNELAVGNFHVRLEANLKTDPEAIWKEILDECRQENENFKHLSDDEKIERADPFYKRNNGTPRFIR